MGLYIKSLNEIAHNDNFDIYSYIEMKTALAGTERLSHRFSLAGYAGKIYFISQINYIILGASWQGAYFYTNFKVAISQLDRKDG